MPSDLLHVGDGVSRFLLEPLPLPGRAPNPQRRTATQETGPAPRARCLNLCLPASGGDQQPLTLYRKSSTQAEASWNLDDLGPNFRVGLVREGPRAHLGLYLRDLVGRYSFGLDRISSFPNRRRSSDCLPYLVLKGNKPSFKEKQRNRDPDTARAATVGAPEL